MEETYVLGTAPAGSKAVPFTDEKGGGLEVRHPDGTLETYYWRLGDTIHKCVKTTCRMNVDFKITVESQPVR